MINHTRTLLLNRTDAEAGRASGNPGAEAIDPTFVPVTLPQMFRDVRDILLPPGYTPYQENMALAYIMRLVHAPDLAPYNFNFDSRITYDFDDDYAVRLRDAAVSLDSWRNADSTTSLVYDHYDLVPNTTGDVLVWHIIHAPSDGAYVKLQLGDAAAVEEKVLFEGARSRPISLLQDVLQIKFEDAAEELTGTFRFKLTYYVPIQFDLVRILERLNRVALRSGLQHFLFGQWGVHGDDLTTLKDTWYHSPEASMRFGAVVLAYAYQCERLREEMTLHARSVV